MKKFKKKLAGALNIINVYGLDNSQWDIMEDFNLSYYGLRDEYIEGAYLVVWVPKNDDCGFYKYEPLFSEELDNEYDLYFYPIR